MTETPNSPIRVLLVEDSTLVLTVLRRILANSDVIRVVGTAANGQEALRMIQEVDPTVVCTDLHMPVMDGLELTRHILRECPRPILVISGAVDEDNAENVFQLLEAGALDVFPKPKGDSASDYELIASQLIRKIRVLSGVHVMRKKPRKVYGGASPRASRPPQAANSQKPQPNMLAIGASTGGPQAFNAVLSKLPAEFPVPIVCVQHISDGFLLGMAKWLDAHCQLNVKIAESGDKPNRGNVYFAPDGMHLEVDSEGLLVTNADSPLDGHRPSITKLFNSVARHAQSRSVGVLLTGMGRDGADGLQAIAGAGGATIAQDEETCVVYGMPKAAVELSAAQHVLPLSNIPLKLKQICMSRMGANT